MHILRIEDVLASPRAALAPLCDALGVGPDAALDTPSWNGAPLPEVYPWGTIRTPTPEANRATALELTPEERGAVGELAWRYLDAFDYRGFV